ncbi:hypothetical protein GBA63_21140 [Rubrobacter tropicus]|uniref:Uncharacterized protein n=1 Tax=Rubrobacter tropicus TaxID=2653851 RepID=A0A6G8QF51_9ACTN|nr:hypothetical protein [Rubrobacter tropicus]QIN84867.1 hypothetical protein GBA63_21140 [Rubrobacter tropicus]
MEEHGEVCLAEEAERLWRSGMRVDEVSRRMGVDAAWVESVISPLLEDETRPEKVRPIPPR